MDALVINLFGGPGTGKSTLGALIFAKLKMLGVDVEMAHEYVKDLVWEESFKKIENQIYIFGKQHNRMFRLKNKVQVVITDSPLINSIVYYNGINPHFNDLIMFEYKKMNNLSFYLERGFEYVQSGRVQGIEDAILVDKKYKEVLDTNLVEYTSIKSPYDIDLIINMIVLKLKDNA